MKKLIYTIQFFSDWHSGSGLSAGADVDETVMKDKNNLPFIPGRTIKGLLRDSLTDLVEFGSVTHEQLSGIFGSEENLFSGECFFSNASLSNEIQQTLLDNKNKAYIPFLYRKITSTAIDTESGIAQSGSLRKIEVTIPLSVYGEIYFKDNETKDLLLTGMKMIKRLGCSRNKGFGRCDFSFIKEEDIQ